MKILKCPVCGTKEPEQNGNYFYCSSCNTTFTDNDIKDIELILDKIDTAKQELMYNARKMQYSIVHNDNGTINNRIEFADLKRWSEEVLKYSPDDTISNFYILALDPKKAEERNKFLFRLANRNVPLYIRKNVVLFMIEYITSNNMERNALALTRLIDTFDIDIANKYKTALETEIEKFNAGQYHVDIPRDVFVCYSGADIEQVIDITGFLQKNGIECFVSEINLKHGTGSETYYWELIYEAIKNCKVFLFVSSENSRKYGCGSIKEIKYVNRNLPDMKRIEYLLTRYEDDEQITNHRLLKQFFDGCEWTAKNDKINLLNKITDILDEIEEQYLKPKPRVDDTSDLFKQFLKEQQLQKEKEENERLEKERLQKEAEENLRREFEQRLAEEKERLEQEKQRIEQARIEAEQEKQRLAEEKEQARIKAENERAEADRIRQEYEQKLENERKEKERITKEKLNSARLEEERKRQEEERKREQERLERERQERERRRLAEQNGTTYNISSEFAPKRQGNYVYFGSYPQSDKNKKEPIKWQIIEEKNGELLLLSDKILDSKRFDPNKNNYETSEIRSWLNGTFINTAFNDSQKGIIVTSDIVTDKYGGGTLKTNDKIFLLSKAEAEKYFKNDDARKKQGTKFAKDNGLYVNDSNGNSWWWLRSPSSVNSYNASNVSTNGNIHDLNVYNTNYGVVPALRIKSSDLIQ